MYTFFAQLFFRMFLMCYGGKNLNVLGVFAAKIYFKCPNQRIYSISVIEGTAPAIVLQRFDSPNLSPPALSDGQVVYTADRVERGWVSQIFVRR